jgi:hypothetical protein
MEGAAYLDAVMVVLAGFVVIDCHGTAADRTGIVAPTAVVITVELVAAHVQRYVGTFSMIVEAARRYVRPTVMVVHVY